MKCKPIKMADGTTVLAMMKPGAKLTAQDEAILADWVQFCRDRKGRRGQGKEPQVLSPDSSVKEENH